MTMRDFEMWQSNQNRAGAEMGSRDAQSGAAKRSRESLKLSLPNSVANDPQFGERVLDVLATAYSQGYDYDAKRGERFVMTKFKQKEADDAVRFLNANGYKQVSVKKEKQPSPYDGRLMTVFNVRGAAFGKTLPYGATKE